MQTPNCHMVILHPACYFVPLLSWQCNFGVQLRAPGSGKVLECNFCALCQPGKDKETLGSKGDKGRTWFLRSVGCLSVQSSGIWHSNVLGAPQVPAWRCSRCPSTRCQLVLLTALCVSGWVLDLCVQFGFVDTSDCSAQGYSAAAA